eukprot:RCo045876
MASSGRSGGKALLAHPVRVQRLCFLGTSSATPTRTRNVTSSVLSFDNGSHWLFDCGEGTQHQLMRSPISHGRIDKIFVTHLHGDHCFGLPGLLCTMSLARLNAPKPEFVGHRQVSSQFPNASQVIEEGEDGTDDFEEEEEGAASGEIAPVKVSEAPVEAPSAVAVIDIFGPYPLGRFLRQVLNTTRCAMVFRYRVHEAIPHHVTEDELQHYRSELANISELRPRFLRPSATDGSYAFIESSATDPCVSAAELSHAPGLICLGYAVTEPERPGMMNAENLKKLGVRGPLCSQLKAGESVTLPNGRVVHPSEVMTPSQKGRRFVILGDTFDSERMVPLCMDAEVVVHEATFAEEHHEMALRKHHSTAAMAGLFARRVQAKQLVLTHFSARFSCSRSRADPSTGFAPDAKRPRLADPGTAATTTTTTEGLPDVASGPILSPSPCSSNVTYAGGNRDATLVTPLVEQAVAAFGCPNVVAASDFMEVSFATSRAAQHSS